MLSPTQTMQPRPPAVARSDAKPAQRTRAPLGFLWALAVILSFNGIAWLTSFVLFHRSQHTVLVLSDSTFAGHRIEPGVRFQDWLQRDLGSDWSVVNFAEPSAQPGDFYLKLVEAQLLGVKPELVVVGLTPQKLVPEIEGAMRLNEDGSNLGWLPLDREGYRFFQTLDDHLQRAAIVRKAGMLFGFYDGLRALSLRYLEWPMQRRHTAHASEAHRSEWIRKHAEELDQRCQHAQASLQLQTTAHARDFAFFIDALRARHIRVVVVMPPALHPNAMRMLSQTSLHNLHGVYQQTLAFCEQLGVPVLDFNAPDKLQHFVPSEWDDLNHLRAPACYRRMARAVYELIQTWSRA